MRAVNSNSENREGLAESQKAAILETYQESLHDEGVDAIQALEEIRTTHGFSEQEEPGELSEELKREILHSYNEALRGEVVDALAAIEDIRRRHNL